MTPLIPPTNLRVGVGALAIITLTSCASPAKKTKEAAQRNSEHLTYEVLKTTALSEARQRGLLDPQFYYNVFLFYLGNSPDQDTVIVEFAPNEASGFDGAVRIPISEKTGKVKTEELGATSPIDRLGKSDVKILAPIEIASTQERSIGPMTVQELATELAMDQLLRNTKYNVEYLWLDDRKKLEVTFRPVWKKSEAVVKVTMDFGISVDMEE